MIREVIEKTTARAADAVLASTVEMWAWDVEWAGRTAAEDVHEAWGSGASTEVDLGEVYTAMAAERAARAARAAAKLALEAKSWEVYGTPDQDERRWVLVPLGWDGTPRTGNDAAEGHLVIEPHDTVEAIEAKLTRLRERRRTPTSA